MCFRTAEERFAARAVELAQRGEGHVEPNPMVGCVVVRGDEIVGEGWHRAFGGPHAEIEALADAGDQARGATMVVSLEPCCHTGKTPPCTEAIVEAGVARVVVAVRDPNPQVAGNGFAALRGAGVEVEVGIGETEAQQVLAPYLKRIATGKPWVIAKWAMTLDGKIATTSGDSQWISNNSSREIVHRLRGRVDAIVVGRGTAKRDDPLLIARPPGSRVATRIVVDSNAALTHNSKLVQTAHDAPVLVAVAESADADLCRQLEAAGVEVLRLNGIDRNSRLESLLDELGSRSMTNVLVEGGAELLGSLFDQNAIDEVHVFCAAKLIGGAMAPSPLGGVGLSTIAAAQTLDLHHCQRIESDVYLQGRVRSG